MKLSLQTHSFFIFLACFLIAACSSEPKKPAAPEWTHGPARVVDNGYIVYVESSEDADPDKAKFKSEAAALEDLANECSFIPKEARVEDRFQEKTEHMNFSFTKVAIEFQVCDQARKTIAPDEILKTANVPMTEEVKRYQELLGKPEVAELSDAELPSAPPAGAAAPSGGELDHVRFFIVREQIWHAKQDVILATPGTYAPGTVAQTNYMQVVTPKSTAVTNYTQSHPNIVSSPQAWSHYRSSVVRKYGGQFKPRGGKPVVPIAKPAVQQQPKQQKRVRRRRKGEID